jgi:hypothetical protein
MTARVKDKSKKTNSKVSRIPEESELTCTHFWVIERPLGPTSKGACKYCGAVKEFVNEPSLLFNPRISFRSRILDEGEDVFDGDCSGGES